MFLLTPFYRFDDEVFYKAIPLFRVFTAIKPYHKLTIKFKPVDDESERKWGHIHSDPKQVRLYTPATVMVFYEEQKVASEAIKNCTLPILMVQAEKDGVVRNDYIEDFYAVAGKNVETQRIASSKVPNQFLKIAEVDHTTICFEESSVQTLITQMVSFFDKIIKEKNVTKKLFF